MSLSKKSWTFYVVLSVVALGLWLRFGYPEFSFIDLSVSRNNALEIAEQYLSDNKKINPQDYHHAIILNAETATDRYLQKTLGFNRAVAFLKENDLNLFFWLVRFFKEGEKEEYFVAISASTGEIIHDQHLVEETAQRPNTSLETAYDHAEKFFIKNFNVNFDNYEIKEKVAKKYDNRTDFSFSWQKKNVNIPWSEKENTGTAKLLIKARVSGDEILFFDKNTLEIPDGFNRAIEKSKQSGGILTSIFFTFYYILIIAAVYLIVIRRQFLIMQKTKIFYIGLSIAAFILFVLSYVNNVFDILFDYPTTSTINIYFTQISFHLLITSFFIALIMALPGFAGESLIQEIKNKKRGFAYYLQTTFFSRNVFRSIIFGYLIAVILLGIQALLFALGRKYCNVWTEHLQISQLSSSFWPFLAAFVISVRASFTEELTFRLFGIHWGQKIFKNIIIASIVLSIIWGFGHTSYPVFPTWFRGLETSILGFVLSFFYLRFGIIPAIVGHYLMDAFLGSAGFLFGKAPAFDFFSSLFIILLPLIFGLIAYFMNKPDIEQKIFWKLSERHLYNIRILKSFLTDPQNTAGKTKNEIREELLNHGWDTLIVDETLKNTGN